MRRLFAILLGVALLLPATVNAGSGSINAPDGLTFGDSFSVTYTEPNHLNGSLWAYAECRQGGDRVWGQYERLPADEQFVLGPTPSWTGGAADCLAELVVFSTTGRRTVNAGDAFFVGP